MYVKSFGYGTSTVVETQGATDTFVMTWRENVKWPWTLSHLSAMRPRNITHQMSRVSVKSKRQERTVIRSSPGRSHQSNRAVENYQKQLQGQARTMLAALQECTQYRPTTGSAVVKWIL